MDDDDFENIYLEAIGQVSILRKDFEHKGFSCLNLNGNLILDITFLEPDLSNINVIDLKLADGTEIGRVVPVKGVTIGDLTTLPGDQIFYIWNYYRKNNKIPKQFASDILILKECFFPEYYKNLYNTSSFWGGFIHKTVETVHYKTNTDIICPDLNNPFSFPTIVNQSNSELSLESYNIYNVFLKKYHQLELLFNLVTVQQLKNIELDNIKEINAIYKNINKKELETITYIIEQFSTIGRQNKILDIFVKAYTKYRVICDQIFKEYGKEGNPLKEEKAYNNFIAFTEECSLNDTKDYISYESLWKKQSKPHNAKDLKIFINILSAYCIYRIRCSIAHKKLSEFIFESNKEHFDFMIDVALPLIKETVIDIFANENFKTLFAK
ncbi:unnamed protein product [Commensalibacter communis]|uniref:hypothetical protein n=1 Tax=Commensalibacter communis TaxID=2972786 RepID=UPI0022FFC1F3|nr:hypothetical protein [Commensalibacter communis]CAI3956044.1 unnamed protein product [Commensalibacter communis]CAI3956828.1 unnamed protein product [Commensalibacter communis]